MLVVSCGLAYFLAIGTLLPTIPKYVQQRLDGGSVAIGAAVGAFSFGAVVLRPFVGRLGDRLGRKVLIVGGALTVGFAYAAVHLATNLPLLIATRLLAGAGEAAFFVGAGTMATDLAPAERRGEAVSYWSVAVYGGLALGPALGEHVVKGGHFGRVWTLSAALTLGAAVLGLWTRETHRAVEADATSHPDASTILYRKAVLPGVVLFLGMIGLAGFAEFVPLYVKEVGLSDSSTVLLTYGLLILVVRVLGAKLPDRLGPLVTGSLATALSAIGLIVIGTVATPAGLFGGTAIFAIGMSQLYPAILLLAFDGVPISERSAAMGTVSSFFDAASGLGAIALGGVAALTNHQGAFVAGGLMSAAALVLLRRVAPKRAAERSVASMALVDEPNP